MPSKGAGSWPLAGGRNSTAACTKGENPNFQLWGAVWLFCPQSLERERTSPSTNQLSWVSGNQRLLLPLAFSTFAPVASGLADTQLPTLSPRLLFYSKCVYSPFVDVLAVTANMPGGHRQNGQEREGNGRSVLQKEGPVMCILHLKGLGRNWS